MINSVLHDGGKGSKNETKFFPPQFLANQFDDRCRNHPGANHRPFLGVR